MSYRISFTISCPQLFPEESPRLPAEILLAQGADQPPAFSIPSGCPRFDGRSVQCLSRGRSIFTMIRVRFTACFML